MARRPNSFLLQKCLTSTYRRTQLSCLAMVRSEYLILFLLVVSRGVHGFASNGRFKLTSRPDLIGALRSFRLCAANSDSVQEGVDGNDEKTGKYRLRKGMGKEYIKEIDSILGRSKRRDDKKVGQNLVNFLDKKDSVLNRAHALAMVRLSSKYQFDLTSAITLSKVIDLFDSKRLEKTSHESYREKPWEAYMLSQVLYGLRMFNDKTEGLNDYLDYLASAMEESEFAGKKMNNQEVANSLYGLAGLDATPTVERIIEGVMRLAPERIQTISNTFGAEADDLDDKTLQGIIASPMTGQEISMAIYGLRTMSISHRATRSKALPKVLLFLSEKIVESTETMSPRACANALNGLRGLNPSKMAECRALLEVLAPRIVASMKSGQRFDPVAVGSALSGMKAMDASTPQVLDLIDAVADIVENSGDIFSQNTIASCVIGLSALSDDEKPVRRLMAGLATKVNQQPHCLGGVVEWMPSHASPQQEQDRGKKTGDEAVEEEEEDEEEDLESSRWSGVAMLKLETSRMAVEINREQEEVEEDGEEKEGTSLRDGMDWRSGREGSLEPGDEEGEEALFTAGTIAACFMSLRHMSGKYWQTRALVDALQKKIMLRAKQPFTSQDMGKCLYGLQGMSGTSTIRGKYPRAVKDTFGKLGARVEDLSVELRPRDVGSSLYGLKGCKVRVHRSAAPSDRQGGKERGGGEDTDKDTDKHRSSGSGSGSSSGSTGEAGTHADVEVRSLLHALALRIAEHPDVPIGAQSFGMALLGMRNMNSDVREVRQVLHALTPRMHCSKLDRQACANILYSMNQMSSGRSDVRAFLSALTPKIAQQVNEGEKHAYSRFGAQEISNALLGMQRMDSKHVETIAVLVVLLKALKRLVSSDDPRTGLPVIMTSQGVGNALFGLQTMENENNHLVDECFELFAELLGRMEGPMTPQDMANALFGLQGINLLTKEAKLLLTALANKMVESQEQWTPKQIGYALVGLSGLQQTAGASEEVANVIAQVNVKLSQSELQGQPGVTFKLFGGKGFKILDAFGNVICKG